MRGPSSRGRVGDDLGAQWSEWDAGDDAWRRGWRQPPWSSPCRRGPPVAAALGDPWMNTVAVSRSARGAAAPGDDAGGEGRAHGRRPGRRPGGVLQRTDRAAGHPRAEHGRRRRRASPPAAGCSPTPRTPRRPCRPTWRSRRPGTRPGPATTPAWSPTRRAQTGHEVLLGPNSDPTRNPFWGRQAESASEDPQLNSAIVVPFVQEVQARNVIADLKHYTAYTQETVPRR